MNNNRLLVVEDDLHFRSLLVREMSDRGFEVSSAPNGTAALAWARENDCDLMLLDLRLPDINGMDVLAEVRRAHPRVEVVLLTGHGTIETAIEAIRLGAFHYLTKPCSPAEVELHLRKACEHQSLIERSAILENGLVPVDIGQKFIGVSTTFRRLVELIDRVAAADSSVLLLGETGVGKELVAKLIHTRSGRRGEPFIVVDCGTLHDDLSQAELFGHEEGAYTGAARLKHGLFEVADGGTVFLDEIGDVSPAMQLKLLRVLEAGTFRRLGGTKEVSIDVRVVAATNRDLSERVERELFREDLFYRLNTIRVDIPPLRGRREDIPHLVKHYVDRFNKRFNTNKHFSAEAMELATAYHWPGNVRELIHVVEQAVVLSAGSVVGSEDLAALRPPTGHKPRPFDKEIVPLAEMTAEVERNYIEFVIEQMGGHRGRAAEALGISERSLYRKMKGRLD